MFYRIVDNESNRDLVPDLIGDRFLKVGMEDGLIMLDTCDGLLLFELEDIEEVE